MASRHYPPVVELDRRRPFHHQVSFELGTNLDIAQVQVQNRVSIAQPRLPIDVRNIGVTVNKSSPDLMMVVHLYSPDKSRDTLFISNYATIEITDAVTRVDGVGSHRVRQPRLRDARLARPRSAAIARSHGKRRGQRACRAERAGRLRRAQSATDGQSVRFPDLGTDARTPHQHRRNSPISSSSRPPNAVVRMQDIARIELPRRTTRPIPISIVTPRSPSVSSSGRARTLFRPRRTQGHDGCSSPSASHRG